VTEERPSGASRSRRRPDADEHESSGTAPESESRRPSASKQADGEGKGRGRAHSQNGGRVSATTAARRAAQAVGELTGHDVETVISIEPCDDGWTVGVEVVETRRIPDSADILASYEVRLDCDGHLVSYRRTQRYARGQLYGARR
jgi:Gas vesicle synthesis protein GvpO